MKGLRRFFRAQSSIVKLELPDIVISRARTEPLTALPPPKVACPSWAMIAPAIDSPPDMLKEPLRITMIADLLSVELVLHGPIEVLHETVWDCSGGKVVGG